MNKPTGTGFRPVPRKLTLLVAAALTSGSTFAGTEPMALRSLSALPISFERNDGQLRPDILFLARGVTGEVAVRHGEIAIAPRRPLRRDGRAILSDEGKTLGVRLAGADPRPVIETREPLATVSHRYEGSSKWENIPHYGRIVMRNVYTDIDLAVHGSEGSLEYDFIVSPGANPSDIRLKLDADRVTLDEVGDLVLQVGGDTLRQRAPVAYQERDGERIVVAARFDLQGPPGAAEAGFILGDYDPALPLVIDPVIGYSTYLGGSGNETGGFVKVDADENVYVAYTSGSGTATAVSVTKFNPNTNSHYFTTTLDGASYEVVNALAIGASGAGVASYITGYTASSNFPHCLGGSGAADCSVYGGLEDAFVSVLNPSGNLVFSRLLGGSGNDAGADITVDAAGTIYVTGDTAANFPTTAGALYRNKIGGSGSLDSDAFVSKLSLTGGLVYSTYLGGSGNDTGTVSPSTPPATCTSPARRSRSTSRGSTRSTAPARAPT